MFWTPNLGSDIPISCGYPYSLSPSKDNIRIKDNKLPSIIQDDHLFSSYNSMIKQRKIKELDDMGKCNF